MLWMAASAAAGGCGGAPTDPARGWVAFAGGTFPMGQPAGAPVVPAAEPARPVAVGPFELARTEVTVAEYAACVASGGCTPPGAGEGCGGAPDEPVNCVSFGQAERYCAAVGARLPTEAEWEFAARGPSGRWFTWGDAWDDRAASTTRRAVGSCPFTDTPEGIHDLAGSGREWTSTDNGAGSHVSKGLECYYDLSCPAYNRFPGQADDEQLPYLGFRCARGPGAAPRPTPPRPASPAPSSPRTVHWSELLDELPAVTAPGEPVLCPVTVTFAPDGSVAAATATAECPKGLAARAEAAVRSLRVAGHERGVVAVVPVRFRP